MAQSTQADGGTEAEDMTEDELAAEMYQMYTAEELRRLAAHIPAVSRPRGATKLETAREIAGQAREAAETVVGGGDFRVTCTCGLDLSVDHPQTALRAAKQHKKRNLTHFPEAVDKRDGSKLYG